MHRIFIAIYSIPTFLYSRYPRCIKDNQTTHYAKDHNRFPIHISAHTLAGLQRNKIGPKLCLILVKMQDETLHEYGE